MSSLWADFLNYFDSVDHGNVVSAVVGLVSGLLGAAIGGKYTLKGAKIAHQLEREQAREEQDEKFTNTLVLLHVEISKAWGIYKSEYAEELMQLTDEQPYLTTFPVGDNPFVIMDSAPEALALMPRDLSEDIVHFYMRAKGVIAMINLNNSDVEECSKFARGVVNELAVKIAAIQGPVDETAARAELDRIFNVSVHNMAQLLNMAEYTRTLKVLTSEVDEVVARIDKRVEEVVAMRDKKRAS